MFCAPTMTTMICVPYFFFPKWKECFVLKGETNAPAMTRTCVCVWTSVLFWICLLLLALWIAWLGWDLFIIAAIEIVWTRVGWISLYNKCWYDLNINSLFFSLSLFLFLHFLWPNLYINYTCFNLPPPYFILSPLLFRRSATTLHVVVVVVFLQPCPNHHLSGTQHI